MPILFPYSSICTKAVVQWRASTGGFKKAAHPSRSAGLFFPGLQFIPMLNSPLPFLGPPCTGDRGLPSRRVTGFPTLLPADWWFGNCPVAKCKSVMGATCPSCSPYHIELKTFYSPLTSQQGTGGAIIPCFPSSHKSLSFPPCKWQYMVLITLIDWIDLCERWN